MKKVWKPGTLLAPVPPTMVSCGTMENPNILTVGWTGITCTDPAQTYISVRKQRHSHSIISQNGYFVIGQYNTGEDRMTALKKQVQEEQAEEVVPRGTATTPSPPQISQDEKVKLSP